MHLLEVKYIISIISNYSKMQSKIGMDMMRQWEKEQSKASWTWDTFKEMLRESKRTDTLPFNLPEVISVGDGMKSLCSDVVLALPLNLEFGRLFYTNMENGALLGSPLQKGLEYEIQLIDTNRSNKLVRTGQMHRHPETLFPKYLPNIRNKMKFNAGEGYMWFSQCNQDASGGDVLSLLHTSDIFTFVLYKNYLGLIVKTIKTPIPQIIHATYQHVADFLKNEQNNPGGYREGLRNTAEKYGLEFYYSTNYETEPLVKVFD